MTHVPVLLKEVLEYLKPAPGKKFIDATIGGGGHAKSILEAGAELLGIDRDREVAQSLISEFKNQKSKIKITQDNFADLKKIAQENNFTEVDGILFDLGMGSHQLDDPARGFAFQREGPLDMRYDQRSEVRNRIAENQTAAKIVNDYPEKRLIEIFRDFGEERRFARKVARAILKQRKTGTLVTTLELFELIKTALPGKYRFKAGDVARRIFQALRIAVNRELENLEKALPQALEILKLRGRIAVISFHSLEDRMVKRFFLKEAKNCICPPEFPICVCKAQAKLRILTKKPVTASEEETKINPRAKSAKLRAAEKIWENSSH